jgi:hypothetical protein
VVVGAVGAGERVSVPAEEKNTGSRSSLRKYKTADTLVEAGVVGQDIRPLEAQCLHTADPRHSQVVGLRSPRFGLGHKRKRPTGSQDTIVGRR